MKKISCVLQARLCRDQARKRPADADHWLSEAKKWEKTAEEAVGKMAVSHEVIDGKMIAKIAE